MHGESFSLLVLHRIVNGGSGFIPLGGEDNTPVALEWADSPWSSIRLGRGDTYSSHTAVRLHQEVMDGKGG